MLHKYEYSVVPPVTSILILPKSWLQYVGSIVGVTIIESGCVITTESVIVHKLLSWTVTK